MTETNTSVIEHLKLMMEASAWDGKLELSDALANIEQIRAALTEALSFNPDWADFENWRECGRLEAIDTSQERVEKSGEIVQVPDPMTLMTDASIMQVAQGWREFDAPDGSGPVDSMVYGACRAALNKYRDLLLEAK